MQNIDNNDEDNYVSPQPPTQIIECINPDGSINILKYLLYQHHQQKLLLQNEYFSSDIDDILDNAIAGYMMKMTSVINSIDHMLINNQPRDLRLEEVLIGLGILMEL
jgi:hypothetical protein